MGGCRCTYKNCTVRSDGKTHLFHFPVFDKVRCHEWISKAGRYDFLNLKVSQLKNRCICQHHFADHWFMNDNKEKLKLKAVPTLDGPYCDSSKFKDPEMPQNMFGLYPLVCEVENDDFILDRKSNYNLVYADFLTNSDTTEPLKYSYKTAKVEEDTKSLIDIENVTPTTNNNITEIDYNIENANTAVTKQKLKRKPTKDSKKTQEMVVEVLPLKDEQNNAIVPDMVKIEVPLLPIQQNNTNVRNIVTIPVQQKKSRVQIISEKKITEPEKKICVPVSSASFEIVKPSMILNISKNRDKSKPNDMISQFNEVKVDSSMLKDSNRSTVNDTIVAPDNDKIPPIMLNNNQYPSNSQVLNTCKEKEEEGNITEILSSYAPSKFEINVNLNDTNPPAKLPPTRKKTITQYNIKNNMSPERVAAINEKRRFNMRLKDIIAEELNRLDEQGAADRGDALIPHSKKINKNNDKAGTETVLSSLSKESSLPNEHAYIVHYLEARMERMENLLLNKIDQNTKKIMSLKKNLDTQEDTKSILNKSSTKKKLSDKEHKKQLYEEISKYLSPPSKCLIYEELFINKYDPNESKAGPAPSKRKRTRR